MSQPTFFFYDLETSGFDPRKARIMQFAGQRTDMDLNPIGEPVNVLVKLTEEILPSPGAILITGITPQKTIREGITEVELMKLLSAEVFTPGTIATGFNSVRFDDTFIRFLHYRNFYDPYEWAYAEGRSRWDLLDVMRLARALRPDGFTWPVDEEGSPVNKLALLASANHLEHTRAHDALSDVTALIGIAAHLRQAQPKFFDYLLALRSKHEVAKIVNLANPEPFVYTSGRYPKDNHHTTVAFPVASGKNNAIIVYDLRHNPADYAGMTAEDLAAIRFPSAEDRAKPGFKPFPAKELSPGNCPAVAPLATLNAPAEDRIHLTRATALTHLKALTAGNLIPKVQAAMKPRDYEPLTDVDARLYEGFLGSQDKIEGSKIRAASPQSLAGLSPNFADPRLPELFNRYKARNYPEILSDDEQTVWEAYRKDRLQADWPTFATELEACGAGAGPEAINLLTDLQMWAESILPAD